MEIPCVEPGCKLPPTSGSHKCPDCKGQMHGICGQAAGEEGYSQPRRCTPCSSNGTHIASTPTLARPPSTSAPSRHSPVSGSLTPSNRPSDISRAKKFIKKTDSSARVRLTFAQKVNILEELKTDAHSVVARRNGIGLRTIGRIKADADAIILANTKHNAPKKSLVKSRMESLEINIMNFIRLARIQKMPITGQVIQAAARRECDKLLQSTEISLPTKELAVLETFKASRNWCGSFVKRNGMRSIRLHGEAGSVDPVAIEARMAELRTELRPYRPANIFNCDETGLFFKLLPKRTYLERGESKKLTRGTKDMKAKDRLTLLVCTNAIGTVMLRPTIIGTAETPRCFRIRKCPLPYFNQSNAWVDSVTFRKWFFGVFIPAVRVHTSSDVALIMDNASSHGAVDLKDPKGQVKIFFLPPNCTAVHQPMDCGIIAAVKVRYRYSLLAKTVEIVPHRDSLRSQFKGLVPGTRGVDEGYPPHVLDVAEEVERIWDLISQQTVVRCWIKSKVLPVGVQSTLAASFGKPAALNGNEALFVTYSAEERDFYDALEGLLVGGGLEASEGASPSTKEIADDLNCSGRRGLLEWLQLENSQDFIEAVAEAEAEDVVNSVHNSQMTESPDTQQPPEGPNEAELRALSLLDIASLFSPLEVVAQDCNVTDVAHYLRKAKQALIRAKDAQKRPMRQGVLPDFLE